MAARTNSPREPLNTPTPLVRVTGLLTSSGKSERSRPTEREWTQRRLGHIRNTFRKRGREPDQLKMMVADEAAEEKDSAELPMTMSASLRSFSRWANVGSWGSARTRMVLVFIALMSVPDYIRGCVGGESRTKKENLSKGERRSRGGN